MLIDTSEDVNKEKGFTLVLTFSRRWCVKPFFDNFKKMKIPWEDCHLLIFDNSDNALLTSELIDQAEKIRDEPISIRYYKTYRRGVDRIKTDEDIGFKGSKLPFIYAMQQDIINLVTTPVFVQIEDDTLPPANAVPRLLHLLNKRRNAGIVTAIETGRSHDPTMKSRTGVHYMHMENGKIIKRYSLSPWEKGIKKVDGCGYYCFATWRDLWRQTFRLMPEDMTDMPRFAMDNIQTNKVKELGFEIYADFSLWCVHMNVIPEGILYWKKSNAVKMVDWWIPELNTYAQGIMIKDPLKKSTG